MGRETAAISIHLQFLVVTHQADSRLPPYLTSRQCALAVISESDNEYRHTPKTWRVIINALLGERFCFEHMLHTHQVDLKSTP